MLEFDWLRSHFEARMAASTSTFRAWANPGRRGSCRVEVEAAILASKRLRSRSGCFDFDFRAWCCMSGIIIPDMRMSGTIIPDMRAASKPLRSRFEARMAASTSIFGCWGPISFPHQATCQPPGVGRWSHDITCGGWGFKYWTLNLQCLVLIMPGG